MLPLGLRPARVHGSRLGALGSRLPLLQAVPYGPSCRWALQAAAGSAVGADEAGMGLWGLESPGFLSLFGSYLLLALCSLACP